MRLLLDTHIALWAVVDDPRLGAKARGWIADPANEVAVSAATIWEIAIKHSLGRGRMPISGERATQIFTLADFRLLPITPEHAARVELLPAIHQDPFDRLLVAQAQVERMRLISHDANVARYGAFVERV